MLYFKGMKKQLKHIQIKNSGSPNSTVRKLTKIFMTHLKKGILYQMKMNFIMGLYRRLL